ncbi:MAG: hypothetical protein U1F16_15910 [Turneriella sp.]
MFNRIIVLLSLALAAPLVALTPAERVSQDVTLYVEGAPLAEGLTSMRTLVSSIAGEGVWSLMAANFEQKTGINLLDTARLEEIGINTKQQWGLAVNMDLATPTNTPRPEFVMVIPTTGGRRLYDFLKAKVTESQFPINKEIESGRLLHFGSENDPGYLLNTDDALLVANKLEMVKAMSSKASQPITNAQFYSAMRTHLLSKNKNKEPLAAFYLNPKLIVSSLKAQSEMLRNLQKELNKGENAAAPIDENSPYVAEIRDNLQSSGGALIANGERVSFYFSYKYKEGYLSDMSKIYPKIIQVKTSPLASDSLTRNPLHYTLLKFNLMGALELFQSLSPVFTQKYKQGVEEIRKEMGLDIEKQIISTLRGNFNFQVLSIPPEAKTKDVEAWELYGAFGINDGSSENWVKFFKAIEKLSKKQAATSKSKKKRPTFEYDEDDNGKFVIMTSEERIGGKRKPVSVVVLIRENEVIVSNTRANAIKATKSSATTLSERLIRMPYDAAQGIFFLDLQQIYKYMMKSKEAAAMKNYAVMLEKLKSFSIISSIQGDFATAETTLQLKK